LEGGPFKALDIPRKFLNSNWSSVPNVDPAIFTARHKEVLLVNNTETFVNFNIFWNELNVSNVVFM